MHVKIHNTLKTWDFDRVASLLKEELNEIEIFKYPSSLEFIDISTLQVLVKETGYVVNVEFCFREPIAQIIFYGLKIEEKMRRYFTVNIEHINLSIPKKTLDSKQLESDIEFSLRIFQRVINNTYHHYGKLLEEEHTVSSDSLEQQIDFRLREKEWRKRVEVPRPFSVIHATNLKEAIKLGGDLIPLYKGYDKHYLFEEKNEYWLLPRSFVIKLFNCTGKNMLPEGRFNSAEKDVLRDLIYKKWIKKQVVQGTIHFYGLNEGTEKRLKFACSKRNY